MRARTSILCLGLGLAAGLTGLWAAPPPGAPSEAGLVVQLAESSWLRRDDTRCGAAAGLRREGEALAAWSDTSGVLFWQIPHLGEGPYPILGTPRWRQRCERPPAGLWQELRDADGEGRIQLADAGRLPHVRWDWRWSESGGQGADGSRAALGVTLLKRGSSQVREILYVWSRDEPPGTVRLSERTLIPGLLHAKSARIVVRSGGDAQAWVGEDRDLRADMSAAFGQERPGRILRVFVKLPDEPLRQRGDVGLRRLRLEPPISP